MKHWEKDYPRFWAIRDGLYLLFNAAPYAWSRGFPTAAKTYIRNGFRLLFLGKEDPQ